jgi:ketosteroid isomerase-like protein
VSTVEMSYAEVAEGVRAAIAAYAQAVDDGRTEDIVATFCSDGVLEIPGSGVYEGHDALREAYSGFKPRLPQRHVVVNIHVTEHQGQEAKATSDLIVAQKGDSGWAITLVARYHDTLRNTDGAWRFRQRTMKFVD